MLPPRRMPAGEICPAAPPDFDGRRRSTVEGSRTVRNPDRPGPPRTAPDVRSLGRPGLSGPRARPGKPLASSGCAAEHDPRR